MALMLSRDVVPWGTFDVERFTRGHQYLDEIPERWRWSLPRRSRNQRLVEEHQ